MSKKVKITLFRAVTLETLLYTILGIVMSFVGSLTFQNLSEQILLQDQGNAKKEIVDHNRRRLKNKDFYIQIVKITV